MNIKKENEIIIFNDDDLSLEVNINPEEDTVWLTQAQMAKLFQTTKQNVSLHISNVFKKGELIEDSVVKEYLTTADDGKNYRVKYYNLDMIISVGYRVNSSVGIKFRKWATKVLKEYSIKGIVINSYKINHEEQLKIYQLLGKIADKVEAKEVLDILEQYTLGLQLLDDYDHQRIAKPAGREASYQLTYEESIGLVNKMKETQHSDVFGLERENIFKSSIATIYQTYDGQELYPTLEEKAANLLYFLVKNHGFIDGNKRIAATLFIYFLDRNNALLRDGEQIINNQTLAALTIMLAESNPTEKELMINIIMIMLT